MFLLYDYTFRPEGTTNALVALAVARERNVVATDEFLLSPEPFGTATRGRGRGSRAPRSGSTRSTRRRRPC